MEGLDARTRPGHESAFYTNIFLALFSEIRVNKSLGNAMPNLFRTAKIIFIKIGCNEHSTKKSFLTKSELEESEEMFELVHVDELSFFFWPQMSCSSPRTQY